MKTEIRKVTVEKEVYIADDGMEFEDEYDCEAYEMRLIGKRLKMYDYKFEKSCSAGDCYYVKLDTNKEVDWFIALCRYEGIASKGINGPGTYQYVEGTYGRSKEAWVDLNDIISKLEVMSR